jgi:hypothetical protein
MQALNQSQLPFPLPTVALDFFMLCLCWQDANMLSRLYTSVAWCEGQLCSVPWYRSLLCLPRSLTFLGSHDVAFSAFLCYPLPAIVFRDVTYIMAAYFDCDWSFGTTKDFPYVVWMINTHGTILLYLQLAPALMDSIRAQAPGASTSCSFRPCAPQSIGDWTRLFPCFAEAVCF